METTQRLRTATSPSLADATRRLEQAVRSKLDHIRELADPYHFYPYLRSEAWPTYIGTNKKNRDHRGWVRDIDGYLRERRLNRIALKYGDPAPFGDPKFTESTALAGIMQDIQYRWKNRLFDTIGDRPDKLPEGLPYTKRANRDPSRFPNPNKPTITTIFNPAWMRRETVSGLYAARSILRKFGFDLVKEPRGLLEHAWVYERKDDEGNPLRIEFVGLKNDFFTFDFLVNGERRPEMTINFYRRGHADQGVPESMTNSQFDGHLTPSEAWLYEANWRDVISWLHSQLPAKITLAQ